MTTLFSSEHAPVLGARRRSRSWLVPIAVAVAAFVVLVAHNGWLLTEPAYADADYAANEILIDDAKTSPCRSGTTRDSASTTLAPVTSTSRPPVRCSSSTS